MQSPGAIIFLGAACSFLAFANPFFRLPALIAVFPWALAVLAGHASTAREAFRRGWITGTLAAAASLYWIAIPVHDYGMLPMLLELDGLRNSPLLLEAAAWLAWIAAAACPVLMAVVLGLYPGLFCWLLQRTRKGLPALAWGLLGMTAWTAVEALRGWLFTGFPWFPLAAALTPWPVAIQGLAVIGAHGLSGIIAGCGVWLSRPEAVSRTAGVAVLAACCAFSLWSMARPVATTGSVTAAMVQGNIDQAAKWEPDTLPKAITAYSELSRSVAAAQPDVYIWPETALTFFVQEYSLESSLVTDFVREAGVPLIAGAPGYVKKGGKALVFNRAYLITGAGPSAFYDKEHLVPFGEYAPFGRELPGLSLLMQGVGGFTPGQRTAPLLAGRLAMGMLICYESIFAELAWQRVADGANVLVNISNDAWFGRSAAPRQHLELAVLRAVEEGRFLLRATNTGITALIDPKGRVSGQTQLFAPAVVAVTDVGLISEKTVYHRLHGWLESVCALAALGLAALAIMNKRTSIT